MKKKFPEFSLIFPWESSKIQWKILSRWDVLYSQKPLTNQSMNTTWARGTRRTYTKLAKTFPFWVTVTNSLSFPWFCVFFPPNSLSFPWLEYWKLIFKVSPDFQSGWEPCNKVSSQSGTNLIGRSGISPPPPPTNWRLETWHLNQLTQSWWKHLKVYMCSRHPGSGAYTCPKTRPTGIADVILYRFWDWVEVLSPVGI